MFSGLRQLGSLPARSAGVRNIVVGLVVLAVFAGAARITVSAGSMGGVQQECWMDRSYGWSGTRAPAAPT